METSMIETRAEDTLIYVTSESFITDDDPDMAN
jgi:hypothetical protein